MIERRAPTGRLRVLVKNRPAKLNSSRLPKDIHREQNHLRFHRVLVTREGLHHVIRNGIYQKKAGEKKRPGLALADRKPKANKTEYCGNEKCHVTSNPQIVSGDDIYLWRPDPKISRTFE